MCAAMVDCRLWMYSLMGHIPVTYRDSSIGGHYQLLYPSFQYVFPAIFLSTWWWKLSRAVKIDPVTTQISHPYSNTVWTTALYINEREHTTDTDFVSTFGTIHHWRRFLLRFLYRVAQSLLLYATMKSRYSKASVGSIGSNFKLMTTLLASKQCWGVSCCLRHSSQAVSFPNCSGGF